MLDWIDRVALFLLWHAIPVVYISFPSLVAYLWQQISAVFSCLKGLGTSFYDFLEQFGFHQMKGVLSALNVSTVQTLNQFVYN